MPTPQQLAVLRRVAQGRTTRGAALDLDIHPNTAKAHLRQLNLRVYAASAAHAVSRIHQMWPELINDIPALLTTAPALPPREHKMLWYISQGETARSIGARYGVTRNAAAGSLRRKVYRPLAACAAPQAVHHAHMLGLLPVPDEIRWAPTT